MPLQKIEGPYLAAHKFLNREDECFYIMTFIPTADYRVSPETSLIHNFKKPLSLRGTLQWKYKRESIEQICGILQSIFSEDDLKNITIVPVPSAKCKSDPEHDNRLVRVLNGLNYKLDIRELFYIEANIIQSHLAPAGQRPPPSYYREVFKIDEGLTNPAPKMILLFDDVLTRGAQFRACKDMLQNKFPRAVIKGLFLARSVIPNQL